MRALTGICGALVVLSLTASLSGSAAEGPLRPVFEEIGRAHV